MPSIQRDPRLHGLSSDHQHALVLALRAERAAAGKSQEAPEAVWRFVVRAFAEEHEPHFRVEEEVLLPALLAAGEEARVERTLRDHRALRFLLADDERDLRERLRAFGELLEAHVRFEERELFQIAQEKLDGRVLDAVGIARPKSNAHDPWKA